MQLTDAILKKIAVFQRNEITEHYIYTRIAGVTADPHNREVLYRIAAEELTHYTIWKQVHGKRDRAQHASGLVLLPYCPSSRDDLCHKTDGRRGTGCTGRR